jgi:8-oxo-dGTP pyrophosphatase MutT (NUDIX family)
MGFAKPISLQDASWLQGFAGLFIKPLRLQIAALCFRTGETGPEILLVSTRGTGRWILPKGWPEKDKPAFETAVIEAYEEAGVVGKAEMRSIGSFRSFKGLSNGLKMRTKVVVFKIRFEKQHEHYPEIGQRKCVWVPLIEALDMLDELSLRRFLRRNQHELV